MILNIDVITRNLERLNKAMETFPILLAYKNSFELTETDLVIKQSIKYNILSEIRSYGLSEYSDFIFWINSMEVNSQSIIYNNIIDYDDLRDIIVENCKDTTVREIFRNKTKNKFIDLLHHDYLWKRYDGKQYLTKSKRYSHNPYHDNLTQSTAIITNYIIQNNIDVINPQDIFSKYYFYDLSNIDITLRHEIDITNDTISFIIDKIVDYDFRKINFSKLISEVTKELQSKMLSVETGEKIKCILNGVDITIDKYYDVISYRMSSNSNLVVSINNDKGITREYNYRLFESIKKLRNKSLDILLN